MSEKVAGTDEGMLVVKGEDVAKVAMALSSQTRIQILNFIKEKDVDMQEVAELIKQSKANASAQMRILEEAGLVKCVGSRLNREGRRLKEYRSSILKMTVRLEKGEIDMEMNLEWQEEKRTKQTAKSLEMVRGQGT